MASRSCEKVVIQAAARGGPADIAERGIKDLEGPMRLHADSPLLARIFEVYIGRGT